MTGLDLYILAQGIDLGNLSGCDNFLHKCLPKSNTNVKFCGCLEKAHWTSGLTKSLRWKWQYWWGNNGKLNVAENTEVWKHPLKPHSIPSLFLTAREAPFLFASSSSILLHLHLPKPESWLHLQTLIISLNTRHHARRTWRVSWIGTFNALVRHK